MAKKFLINRESNFIAWVLLGRLNAEEMKHSIDQLIQTVRTAKMEYESVKVLIDNSCVSDEGALIFEPVIVDCWVELETWFVMNLHEADKIAVIHGGATMKFQMSKLGRSIGLDRIEKHFYASSYKETKLQAYQYLEISKPPTYRELG